MPHDCSTFAVRWFYPGRAHFDRRRRHVAPSELAALVALARAAGIVTAAFRTRVTKRRPASMVARRLYTAAARWLQARGWQVDLGALAAARVDGDHGVVVALFDAVLDELGRAGRVDAVLDRAGPAARLWARPRIAIERHAA